MHGGHKAVVGAHVGERLDVQCAGQGQPPVAPARPEPLGEALAGVAALQVPGVQVDGLHGADLKVRRPGGGAGVVHRLNAHGPCLAGMVDHAQEALPTGGLGGAKEQPDALRLEGHPLGCCRENGIRRHGMALGRGGGSPASGSMDGKWVIGGGGVRGRGVHRARHPGVGGRPPPLLLEVPKRRAASRFLCPRGCFGGRAGRFEALCGADPGGWQRCRNQAQRGKHRDPLAHGARPCLSLSGCTATECRALDA